MARRGTMAMLKPLLWVGVIAAVAGVIYILGKPAPRSEPQEEPMISLVLLRRTAEPLTPEQVQQACTRAFGGEFPLNDHQAERSITKTPTGPYMVRAPGAVIGVISHSGSYMNNPAAVAEQDHIPPPLKQALLEHRSWLAVDWIEGRHESPYVPIGKLLAELADANDLALYCPASREMNSFSAELLPLLRGPDPLAAFRTPEPHVESEP